MLVMPSDEHESVPGQLPHCTRGFLFGACATAAAAAVADLVVLTKGHNPSLCIVPQRCIQLMTTGRSTHVENEYVVDALQWVICLFDF